MNWPREEEFNYKYENERVKLCDLSEQEKPIYIKILRHFGHLKSKVVTVEFFKNISLVINYTTMVIDYMFKNLNILTLKIGLSVFRMMVINYSIW